MGAGGTNASSTRETRVSLTVQVEGASETYVLGVELGGLRASDLRKVKVGPGGRSLVSYDPGFANTASCKSTITYIDPDAGVLEYRGYPIAELAHSKTF